MSNYHRHSWLTVFSLIVLTLSLAFSSPAPAQDIKPEDIYREIGYIPMADGVKLAYINYRPKKEGKYPVLLIYNVYWGGGQDLGGDEREYLRHGYAVLSVSVRGTGCSEGSFTSFFSPPEGKDGAAVVEWAGTREWSTGSVGMYGNSYSGISQIEVAIERPKYLKAIAAGGVTGDSYRDGGYPGGIFNFGFMAQWTYFTQPNVSYQGVRLRESIGDPPCRTTRASRPAHGISFQEILQNPLKDSEWWEARNFEKSAHLIEVPTMIIHGWQDQQVGAMGPVGLFEKIKAPKKMYLSNGGHGAFAIAPMRAERIRWFDRWLKGEQNGIDKEPPVTIWFETHTEERRPVPSWTADYSAWPPPETKWTPMYLTADGKISAERPGAGAAAGKRSYIYPAGTEIVVNNQMFSAPPVPIGSLSYRTAPMTEDTAILGSPVVTLYVSSQQKDTDFMVALHDVYPDGKVMYLQRGFLRASHRALDPKESTAHRPVPLHSRVEELEPGKIYELKFSLIPLGHVIRKGHSLEVAILAPPTMPLPNWGFAPVMLPGINTVYHSAEHPSSIELPLIPGMTAKTPARACGSLQFQPCRETIPGLVNQSKFLDQIFGSMKTQDGMTPPGNQRRR